MEYHSLIQCGHSFSVGVIASTFFCFLLFQLANLIRK